MLSFKKNTQYPRKKIIDKNICYDNNYRKHCLYVEFNKSYQFRTYFFKDYFKVYQTVINTNGNKITQIIYEMMWAAHFKLERMLDSDGYCHQYFQCMEQKKLKSWSDDVIVEERKSSNRRCFQRDQKLRWRNFSVAQKVTANKKGGNKTKF